MKSTSSLLPLLLLIGTVHLHRLSRQENSDLQATCGKSSDYERKVLNADEAFFPFAVSVDISGILTASVISPRHVILFNVVEWDKQGHLSLFGEISAQANFTCDRTAGDAMILPEELHRHFKINFVHKPADQPFEIERILVLSSCIQMTMYRPLIVELKRDLELDNEHQAVCLSKDMDAWTFTDIVSVFGLGPKGHILTSGQFKPKRCAAMATTWKIPPYVGCAKPVNESQGLCAGDFGGGAVAEFEGKNTLLGIYVEGNDKCGKDPKKHEEPEFIEVAAFSDEICRLTGICVKEEDYEAVEETTTDGELYGFTDESTDATTTTEEPSEEPSEIHVERVEPLRIANCSEGSKDYSTHIKNIHIHLHLDSSDNIEEIDYSDEDQDQNELPDQF